MSISNHQDFTQGYFYRSPVGRLTAQDCKPSEAVARLSESGCFWERRRSWRCRRVHSWSMASEMN
jgi:hypothetical protein